MQPSSDPLVNRQRRKKLALDSKWKFDTARTNSTSNAEEQTEMRWMIGFRRKRKSWPKEARRRPHKAAAAKTCSHPPTEGSHVDKLSSGCV